MAWFFAVAERDHEIQNPTSGEKIRLLGERLRLGPHSHVLDVACGKGGPALILANEFGCRITGVERAPELASVARERAAAARNGSVKVVECDAREFELRPDGYDAVVCLGASFIWNGLEGTLAALAPAARRRGHVVVGEPYWRTWPLPDGRADEGYAALEDTVNRFEVSGLRVETVIDASLDDWDRYETLHWRGVEEWLEAHADDADAPEIRRLHEASRTRYLSWQRELLGWAIFAARKR